MHTGVIIRRGASHAIADAYLEKAVENNPSAWGAAIVEDGTIQLNKGDGPSVELIQETTKAFDDKDITFFLASVDAALNIDDIPPHILLGDSDKPVLVGFVEGNFPGHAKKESAHPPEFFFTNEFLIPKLQSLYEMVDNDIDKLMKNLLKPIFKKDLLQGAVSRGVVTLIACNGVHLTYSIADNAAEFPWGWVSNNYGYPMPETAEKKPTEEVKPKAMFPKRSTVREPASSAAVSAQSQSSPAPAAGANAKAAAAKNYTVSLEKPPAHLSRRDTKGWYKQYIGYTPKGHEGKIAVHVYMDENGKKLTMSQVKELGLKAAGLPQLENPPHEKDTEPDHVTSPPTPNGPPVSGEILPLMSPSTREWINKMRHSDAVKKIIAENAVAIQDPKHVQELEAKFAAFAAQLGAKDMSEFMPWSYEMFWDLARNKPDGIAVFAWNLMNFYKKHTLGNKLSTAEKTELAADELKPAKAMFPKRANG